MRDPDSKIQHQQSINLNSEIGTTDCTEYTENEGIMKKHRVTLKMICPQIPTPFNSVHSVHSVVHHFPFQVDLSTLQVGRDRSPQRSAAPADVHGSELESSPLEYPLQRASARRHAHDPTHDRDD